MQLSPRGWLPLAFAGLIYLPVLHADNWTYTIEGGAGVAPRYSGSDESVPVPILGLSISGPYGFFLDTSKGVGWSADLGTDAAFAAYVGASPTRRDHRSDFQGSDRLRGMGSIKTRPLLGIDASFRLNALQLISTLRHAFKDNEKGEYERDYTALRLGIGAELGGLAAGQVRGLLLADLGDSHYMRTWYGVSRTQAARTRYAAYRPHGGLADAGVAMSWSAPLSPGVSTTISLEALRLVGDAADSPLVRQRTQVSLGAIVSYTF